MLIHETDVQNAVVHVEIKASPDWDQYGKYDKPNRVARKGDQCGPAVGVSIPHEALPQGPELHGNKRPEHIVPNLVFKPKRLGVLHHRSHVVAHLVTLRAELPQQ